MEHICRRIFCLRLAALFLLSGCHEDYKREAFSYKLGRVSELLYDQVYQREYNFLVTRDKNGWAAMDGRCSYDGCDLTYQSDIFYCPCCRSKFTHRGRVINGPATKRLPWYEMSYENNQLFVNTGKPVPRNYRFTSEEIEQGIVELGLKVKKETEPETIALPEDLRGRESELSGMEVSDDYRKDGIRDLSQRLSSTKTGQKTKKVKTK